MPRKLLLFVAASLLFSYYSCTALLLPQQQLEDILGKKESWEVEKSVGRKYLVLKYKEPVQGNLMYSFFVSHLDSNDVFHKEPVSITYDKAPATANFYLIITQTTVSNFHYYKEDTTGILMSVFEWQNKYYEVQSCYHCFKEKDRVGQFCMTPAAAKQLKEKLKKEFNPSVIKQLKEGERLIWGCTFE